MEDRHQVDGTYFCSITVWYETEEGWVAHGVLRVHKGEVSRGRSRKRPHNVAQILQRCRNLLQVRNPTTPWYGDPMALYWLFPRLWFYTQPFFRQNQHQHQHRRYITYGVERPNAPRGNYLHTQSPGIRRICARNSIPFPRQTKTTTTTTTKTTNTILA